MHADGRVFYGGLNTIMTFQVYTVTPTPYLSSAAFLSSASDGPSGTSLGNRKRYMVKLKQADDLLPGPGAGRGEASG